MRSTLLFIFSVLTIALPAQRSPADIKWGNENKKPRKAVMADLIGNDQMGYYALRIGTGGSMVANNNGKIILERYNMGMKLVKSAEIKLSYKRRDLQFEGVRLIGDKLYLFTSYRNRKRKINYLFAQTISKHSLRVRKDMHIVAQVPARKQPRGRTFDLEFSRDSSKILFFGQLPYQSNKAERYQVMVTDKELNPIWKKDIELPYSDHNFVVEDYRVDSEGNVYVLGVNYAEGFRKRSRNKPNYNYTLLTYSRDGSLDREYPIDLGDKFITDLTFRLQKNGDPVCAGFYSEKNSYSVKGTYFFKMNAGSGEVYDQNLKEFDFDFLTEQMTDRQKRKAIKAKKKGDEAREPELYQYDLDKLVLRSDGGAVLIAEQYYVREESTRYRDINGMWSYRNRTHYHYGNIIVVNINPSGEIDWAAHVPKRQATVDDGGYFSSYSVAVTGKAIYLVFNDNAKNFDPEKTDRKPYAFNGSRSIAVLAEVKPDGSVSKYPLFSNREEGIITRPKVSKQTHSNELVIYGEKTWKYKFAKLMF